MLKHVAVSSVGRTGYWQSFPQTPCDSDRLSVMKGMFIKMMERQQEKTAK